MGTVSLVISNTDRCEKGVITAVFAGNFTHANFYFKFLNKMGKLGHVNGPPQLSKKDLVQALTIILRKSSSGASQGTIDFRIEQAMDLVKSHLMAAVRTEVDELRDKISKLEDTVSFLSRENEFLRAHVIPEVLSNLPGPRGLPSSDTTISSVGTLQTQTTSSGQSHS